MFLALKNALSLTNIGDFCSLRYLLLVMWWHTLARVGVPLYYAQYTHLESLFLLCLWQHHVACPLMQPVWFGEKPSQLQPVLPQNSIAAPSLHLAYAVSVNSLSPHLIDLYSYLLVITWSTSTWCSWSIQKCTVLGGSCCPTPCANAEGASPKSSLSNANPSSSWQPPVKEPPQLT